MTIRANTMTRFLTQSRVDFCECGRKIFCYAFLYICINHTALVVTAFNLQVHSMERRLCTRICSMFFCIFN